MEEPAALLADEIGQAIARVDEHYDRLVLVVTSGSESSPEALRALAREHNLQPINLNLALSRRLLDIPAPQRPLVAFDQLRAIVDDAGPGGIFLFNTELLFDASLKLNPLQSLRMLARHRAIVATWNGSLGGKALQYAVPGHPDFRRFSTEGITYVVIDPETI